MAEQERETIEKEIERTRDDVGERIDELDRKLRTTLDFKTFASEHAGEFVAGGAVVGFLAGFGFPKLLRRAVAIGVPLALIAMKVRSAQQDGSHVLGGPPDYEI